MVRLFGIVPLGIGLSVIGFLWLSPFGAFHSPPLFFRIFGTFVALPFVFIGVAAFLAKPEQILQQTRERAERLAREMRTSDGASSETSTAVKGSAGYICPSCNAPLASNSDVSPSGDAKCAHCGRWFNIHA